MKKSNPVIIAYDISQHKPRKKVLKILKEWRLDGQKSVHECCLTKRSAEELFLQITSEIDTKTDHLIMAWVEPRRKILARGIGKTDAMIRKIWTIK